MSELPVNEPNDEMEPVAEEFNQQEEPEMDTPVQAATDDAPPEAGSSRRWLGVGIAIVVLLVLVAGAAWLVITRNREQTQWEQAQVAAQEGAWSLAEQYLDEQLGLQPAFARQLTADALGLRGIARYHQGDLEGALADMNEALSQDAELMDVLAYRALALADSDLAAAQADAQTAVSSDLLSDYLEVQMQNLLTGADEAESLMVSGYLSDVQVADLALAQAAQFTEKEEWEQVLAATTAVLDREYDIGPEQTAQLAYAASMAHQALGNADAAYGYAAQALAVDSGLAESEQAKLLALQAVWHEGRGDFDTAMAKVETAATLDETIVLHQALQAWQAYQTFDMETAVASAEEVLETTEPNSLAAQIAQRTLGGVYTMQDNPQAALPALNAAIAINPGDIETRALRAVNLIKVNQWDLVQEDIDYLREHAANEPVSLWAQAYLAMEKGDNELAHVLLDQAIAQDDTRPEYYALRAESYRTTLDEEMADDDFAAALALDPNNLAALGGQQYRLIDNYDYDQFEETAQKIIEMYPDSPFGYLMLSEYHLNVLDDKEEALQLAEEVIALNPDETNGYLSRARIHFLMNDLEAAQADYEQALQLDPNSVGALKGLADIAYMQDDYETAVSHLDKMVELMPRSLGVRSERASLYMDQEELEKAWEIVHQVLAEDSRFDFAIQLKAYLLTYTGEMDKALGEIEKLINLTPDNPFAYTTKASILLQMGRFDEAAESAERVIALDPQSTSPHRILFSVAIANNDLDEANAQLDLWQEKVDAIDEDVELLSNMQLLSGRFEELVETTTDALAEEPDEPMHYFYRALAQLEQGEVEAGQADLAQALTVAEDINVIADVEETLAESKQVVSTEDGRLQYTNDTFGYTLNYADFWEKRDTSGEQFDLMLVHETDEDFGAAYTLVYLNDVDVTARMVADFVISENSSLSGFTLISSEPANFEHVDGYVIRYELDPGDLFQGKQYVFAEENRFVLLTMETYDSSFAELEEEFDTIAASFEFLTD
jgi:tetratricopeptide (TPR) repeat protein